MAEKTSSHIGCLLHRRHRHPPPRPQPPRSTRCPTSWCCGSCGRRPGATSADRTPSSSRRSAESPPGSGASPLIRKLKKLFRVVQLDFTWKLKFQNVMEGRSGALCPSDRRRRRGAGDGGHRREVPQQADGEAVPRGTRRVLHVSQNIMLKTRGIE